MRIGPTDVRLECRVAGCGEVFTIPVIYRLETDGEPVRRTPGGLALNARVRVDVEATLALEAPLRAHLDGHAAEAETGFAHPDDPGPAPS